VNRLLRVDGRAWALLAALLCAGAIVVTTLCAAGGAALGAAPGVAFGSALGSAPLALALDWQPALGLHEPWRLWTCAWVHGSVAHLLVNVAGATVVAFVGWRGRLSAAAAVAWFGAWPLVQVLMTAIGAERLGAVMPHYDGLSGVLHAGVLVAGLSLAQDSAGRPSRERWIGVAIVAGTVAKVVSEAPWNLAPRPSAELGIAVAPIAHACGMMAGALAWGALRLVRRRAA
jgi:membrane associated rhomboid family serine protease